MSQQKLIHIRLPVELEQALKEQAAGFGISFPAMVRMVLTRYVSGQLVAAPAEPSTNHIGDILA